MESMEMPKPVEDKETTENKKNSNWNTSKDVHFRLFIYESLDVIGEEWDKYAPKIGYVDLNLNNKSISFPLKFDREFIKKLKPGDKLKFTFEIKDFPHNLTKMEKFRDSIKEIIGKKWGDLVNMKNIHLSSLPYGLQSPTTNFYVEIDMERK